MTDFEHKLGFYGSLKDFDIISPIRGALEAGIVTWTKEGKLSMSPFFPPDTGYVLARQASDRSCFMWHHIYFKYYKVVHPGCQVCYKIVATPRTLDELFVVKDIQEKMTDVCAAKCGVEYRDYTPRAYGAYWYAPIEGDPIKNAQKIFDHVRNELDKRIGTHVPLILKKACTEFEMKYGDSDKWNFGKHHDQFCSVLDENWLTTELPDPSQLMAWKMYSMEKWIEYASKIGDATYLNYTDGRAILAEPPVNYAPEQGIVELEAADGSDNN